MPENTIKPKNNRGAIVPQSSKPSAFAVARCLDRVATIIKQPLSKEEAALWIDLLALYPVEMIERAFESYIREAEYPRMPIPKEILHAIRAQLRDEIERRQREERNRQERENHERRARGELVGWSEIIALFKKLVDENDAAAKDG